MQPTANPVQPTLTPVQPTLNPVQPTLTPVQPTLTPVQSTLTPVQHTANPSATYVGWMSSLNEIGKDHVGGRLLFIILLKTIIISRINACYI